MKLTVIVTSALAVFKTSISKALNNHKIDEREFNMLQTLHLEVLNDLSNIGSKMAAETRSQFEKSLLEGIKKRRCLMKCALFLVCYLVCYKNG